jgi:hypothetical protein
MSGKAFFNVIGYARVQAIVGTTQNVHNPCFILFAGLGIHDVIFLQ